MTRNFRLCRLWLIVAFGFSGSARADDVFLRVPVAQLSNSKNVLAARRGQSSAAPLHPGMRPLVSLDGAGDGFWNGPLYATFERHKGERGWGEILLRVPAESKEIAGRLYVPNLRFDAYEAIEFKLRAPRAVASAKLNYWQARLDYYEKAYLAADSSPGASWFRHQVRAARQEVDRLIPHAAAKRSLNSPIYDGTFELFTDGRSVAEKLPLDSLGCDPAFGGPIVDLTAIHPIDMPEAELAASKSSVAADLLAAYVPADQHVVFCRDAGALNCILTQLPRYAEFYRYFDTADRADDKLVERYRRQLGLPGSALGRLAESPNIRGIALTGGDLSFRLGTDVALLFETTDADALTKLLREEVLQAVADHGDATPKTEWLLGLQYESWRSPDREISAYLATVGKMVLLTNSPAQLRRVIETWSKTTPAIASIDEYRHYRDRYRRSDDTEAALVILSEATIRRWCSPQWRIVDSRRVRDWAVLADLQSAGAVQLVRGLSPTVSSDTDLHPSLPERFTWTRSGIVGEAIGSVHFMTPISERPLTDARKLEVDAYERWRTKYDSDAKWQLRPFALRIAADFDKLALDLTTTELPSLGQGGFLSLDEIVNFSRGARLQPPSRDLSETEFVLTLGLRGDRNSLLKRELIEQLVLRGIKSISIIGENSPYWKTNPEILFGGFGLLTALLNGHVTIQVEFSDSLTAAMFLTGLRTAAEGNGAFKWSPMKHGDQAYVKVVIESPAYTLYYCAAGSSVVFSFSEDTIHRTLDQYAQQAKAAPVVFDKPLGDNFHVEAGDQMVQGIWKLLNGSTYGFRAPQPTPEPILTEWRRLFPDRDPFEVHEQVFGANLRGLWVWDDSQQRVKLINGDAVAPPRDDFRRLRFGLTLDPDGVRARAELLRKH